jgi:hypothetical protein
MIKNQKKISISSWDKYHQKLTEINSVIEFVTENEDNENLKERFLSVLKFQKALIRDMDRQGRKIPENIPSVCEITGKEINSIREKEPEFKLQKNIGLFEFEPPTSGVLLFERINAEIEHNTYTHKLNNYSLKAIKKMLGRKIELEDLSNIEDNLTLILEVFKHREYYKKYINIRTFEKKLEDIMKIVNDI